MMYETLVILKRYNVVADMIIAPVNTVWGNYAELFFLLAAFAYAVAFFFFCWDFATAYRFAAVSDRKNSVAGKEPAEVESKNLVKVIGDNGTERVSTASGSGVVTAAPVTGAGGLLRQERRPRARIAVAVTVLGFTINAVAVLLRGAAARRVPWGNMYEFCTTGALVVVGVFLLLSRRKDIRFAGAFVLGLVLAMLVSATLIFYVPVGHLVPALNSYWIIIHVSLAIVSAAMFTVTFIMAVFQLLQNRRYEKMAVTGKDSLKVMRAVPEARVLEDLSYRINVFAFILWSITIVFGAIWAESAWGRFWGWDPKEVWSFIIWLVYAAYLHARSTRGWTGARSAWLSIVGYACIIFNFTVVNIFFNGLHSYGGL